MTSLCKACEKRNVVYESRDKLDPNEDRTLANEYLLCHACHKFYFRYKSKFQNVDSCCNSNEHSLEANCSFCRFQRCVNVLQNKKAMMKSNLTENKTGDRTADFSKVPCKICGAASNGIHFGAVTCEGCKGFFRRSILGKYKNEYLCRENGSKPCPMMSKCRKCRLDRCYAAGMCRGQATLGRYSVLRRANIVASLIEKTLSTSGSELDENRQSSPSSNETVVAGMEIVRKEVLETQIPAHMSSPNPATSTWLIEQTVKAASHLGSISKLRCEFPSGSSPVESYQIFSKVSNSMLQAVANFVNALPGINSGINQIPINDKKLLFSLGYNSILLAQMALDFDVNSQTPNYFACAQGETVQTLRRWTPDIDQIDELLLFTGNSLAVNVSDLAEFSFFCVLLFLWRDDALENPAAVTQLRNAYKIAFLEYLNMKNPDQHMNLAKINNIVEIAKKYRDGTWIQIGSFIKLLQYLPEIQKEIPPLISDILGNLAERYFMRNQLAA